ncbi:UNVERIFIED_CONTAM: ATP-binding cassette domain-containing protein, partial [Kocuria sp. CPCC 205295]|uniref:ATP-binding cassette domain-containing protein n=1 Tax=Kocuria sp. CPCC 205295 TaxID=3073557 RepID=UPI0036DC2321
MHPQRAHFFSAASAPTPLRLDGVSFRYDSRPEQPVLTDVSLTVPPGRTVGLIGENGSGKSTALRLLSGAALPDHGIVEAPESLGVLQQMPAAAGRAGTVADLLRQAAAPLRALEHRIEALAAQMAEEPLPDAPSSLAQQWDDALAEAQHRSLWSLEARVETVLDGLGLGALPRSRPLQDLSGGQRRRLDLAAALLHTPHALLLDAPTNHLDDEAA